MSCKRTDCLYHPESCLSYNCDYMLLTGEKRNSKPGKNCDKYQKATPAEKLHLRRKTANVSFCLSHEELSELIRNQTDIVLGIEKRKYENL